MKLKDLPKSKNSNKSDLLTVVQNGVTKIITKHTLVKDLESSIKKISNQVSNVSSILNSDVLKRYDVNFATPVMGKDPVNNNHLTTKKYVDTSLHNVIRDDGTKKISNNISYEKSPTVFNSSDLVDKNFVDSQLQTVLKSLEKIKGSIGYPVSKAGQTFIIEEGQQIFASNGPQVQKGDLLICIEDSPGGTHGEAGHQFAIINTNVIYATETSPGILRASSYEEALNFQASDSALTPSAYKNSLEAGSNYNRTAIYTDTVLQEHHKGIIAVDTSSRSVKISLPSIGRLKNPKLVKFTIKDESENAVRNPITIVSTGGDSIQNKTTYLLNSNGGSVTLYNEGINKWFLESNISTNNSSSQGVKSIVTDETTVGEIATVAGSYNSVMSIDVDLRDYPIGTGFKVVSHCFAQSNSNTKTVAIGIDGTQVLASSLTGTTAPNAKFLHHEVTVLNSAGPNTLAFGFCMFSQDDTATGLTNNLNLNWEGKISVSVDVNVNPVTDIRVYALQVIPLK